MVPCLLKYNKRCFLTAVVFGCQKGERTLLTERVQATYIGADINNYIFQHIFIIHTNCHKKSIVLSLHSGHSVHTFCADRFHPYIYQSILFQHSRSRAAATVRPAKKTTLGFESVAAEVSGLADAADDEAAMFCCDTLGDLFWFG